MPETFASINVEEAYSTLKTFLTQRGSRIIEENPFVGIIAVQGSIRETAPKTAKKNLRDFSVFSCL